MKVKNQDWWIAKIPIYDEFIIFKNYNEKSLDLERERERVSQKILESKVNYKIRLESCEYN